MPKALVIPLELNGDGTFLTTTDPARILRQRITDLLATSRWERVMRPEHGCDLEGFLFTNVINHLLATKATEIQTTLTNSLTYGSIASVRLNPILQETGIEAAIMVEVLFRVYEGGDIQMVSATIDSPLNEGSS